MTVLLVLSGLVLLALGGELLVRGAVGVAARLGVSPLLAGLTIVGFGTSTPELVTSLEAAFVGSPAIAVGNVVGSNIANIALILGIAALIFPLDVTKKAFARDGLVLGVSSLAALACIMAGVIGMWSGLALLAGLVGYIRWAYLSERDTGGADSEMHAQLAQDVTAPKASWVVLGAMSIGGIAAAIFGAQLLVEGAVALARGWGVSEAVIGLSVVAVGTSLPELIACVVAAIRRHGDVALGNVIGSNIYNVLGILSITTIVEPLTVPQQIARLDIWVLLGLTALLLVFLRTGWRLGRVEGAVLLVL